MNVQSISGRENLFNASVNLDSGINKSDLSIKKEGQETPECQNGVIYEKDSQYAVSGVPDAAIMAARNNQEVQTRLSDLGFYSGPYDGDLSSNLTRKAIKDFQRVYGFGVDGNITDSLRSKLEQASKMKNDILASQGFQNMARTTLKLDTTEKNTLAKTWAFLRVGMGLTAHQAAGVCGNLYAESHFSADNAQDRNYPGDHNPEYVYETGDEVGYGLMQWTFPDWKEGLQNMATTMGSSVSNLNVQLAFFRQDALSIRSDKWNQVISHTVYTGVSDAFLEQMERPKVYNYTERRNFSKSIYDELYMF